MPEDFFPEPYITNKGFKLNSAFVLTPSSRELVWQDWGDVYIVFQPSSTETHVFNDITATVLQSMVIGALTMDDIKNYTAHALNFEHDELPIEDLSFALGRLDELGLVEWSDETSATR